MALGLRISIGIVISMILLLFSPYQSSGKQTPSININAHYATVDIEAKDISLGDVLRAIAAKTGIFLKLGDPLTETVTYSIKALPLEEALKLLLANRNYSLSFNKTEDGDFIPTEIRIVGNSPTDGTNIASISEPQPDEFGMPTNDSHMKKLTREQLGQQFGNTDALLKQMAAVPVVEGPFVKGIRLTKLAEQSALAHLGLVSGDVISHVNGTPVESAKQLLQSVKSPSAEMSVVMISRTHNGKFDNLYIQLH